MRLPTLVESLDALRQAPCATISHPVRLSIRNVYQDESYGPYLLHHPEHETLTLTFPRECMSVTGFTTTHGCKAVYYTKDAGFIKEVTLLPSMTMEVDAETRVTVYTRSKPDLVVSFMMKLVRPYCRL